jgi:hypothetical protein
MKTPRLLLKWLLTALIVFVGLYILFFAQENIAGFPEPTSPAEKAWWFLRGLDGWL